MSSDGQIQIVPWATVSVDLSALWWERDSGGPQRYSDCVVDAYDPVSGYEGFLFIGIRCIIRGGKHLEPRIESILFFQHDASRADGVGEIVGDVGPNEISVIFL